MNQFTHSEAAEAIFNWLYMREQIDMNAQFSAIMGFGSFDQDVPERCWNLYRQDFSQKIIFSGGVIPRGHNLTTAIAFKEKLLELWPNFDQKKLILETQSDSIFENVRFTFKDEGFRNCIYSLLIVASPCYQRRVYLTCKKYIPTIRVVCAPPITDIDREAKKYRDQGTNLYYILMEEIELLVLNSSVGFLKAEIPQEILAYNEVLKNQNLSVI